jgi:HK97 family phage prohead protease
VSELKFVTPEKFHELARTEKLPPDSGLRKEFIAEVKSENDSRRELLFTISTAAVDRDGDKIAIEGWRLEQYRKNPVILWAHDYRGLPIARAKHIWTEGDKLKSIAEFVPRETSEFSDRVYQLYKQGFLSATSVGFRPIKWAWTEDKDRKFGIDFELQELLEYSAVPVPANAEALIEARGMGIDIEPLKEWARGILIPGKISDIRTFEEFLREVGFQRDHAKMLASRGWNGSPEREVSAESCAAFLQQFGDSLK